MGLPEPPCSISPNTEVNNCRVEQSEPLDLRTNNNCICKSPPFKRRKYWFHQREPLDLTVGQYHIGPSFHSVGPGSQETNAIIETENSQSNVIIPNQQKCASVLMFKKLPSKCHLSTNTADTSISKSSVRGLVPFDLTNNKIQSIASENDFNAENTSETISCATIPSSIFVDELGKTSIRGKVLESLSVKTFHNNLNETQSEYLTDTVKNTTLESNTFKTFPINNDDLTSKKHNRDSSTKHFYEIETYNNYKSHKARRISKRKVKNKSSFSVVTTNQELSIREGEDDNYKNEYLKQKVETDAVHSIETNLEQDEESNPKKLKFESSVPPSQNLFTNSSDKELKKTGESFLQEGKCFEVAPKLPRCRECSRALQDPLSKSAVGSDNVLCRFYAFRKLRYSTKGFLATAGFLDPQSDTTQEDLRLWQPMLDMPLPDLDSQMARFMLTHVGDQFCDLCKQEEDVISIHMSEDKKPAWKRPVPGYREMCDVCNTTLFNFHWTCRTCGFAVCIDCYKARKGCMPKEVRVERPWLICVNKRAHDQEKMMLTQIIAADSLKALKQRAHEIRTSLGLPLHCCGCPPPTLTSSQSDYFLNEFSAKIINLDGEVINKNMSCMEEDLGEKIFHPESCDDTTSSKKDKTVSFEDYFSDIEKHQGNRLKIRLSKPRHSNSISCHIPSNDYSTENNNTHEDTVEEVILTVFDEAAVDDADSVEAPLVRHLVCCYNRPARVRRGPVPTRVMTLAESRLLYPDCPHSWLCEGRLLRLPDPSHAANCTIFQDQWKRGQPVLVSGVLKFLDEDLWQPDSFIRDFGDTRNDLVNCMTGRVIPGQYMRKFWEGFQEVSKMLTDEKGKPMLLKLKDWPPGEDFAEMLPKRFEDLMKALPMGEYTKRTGQLNLPARLPSIFARPDLGPKMYIAYGSAIHPTKGTTNLHLDISDAVNVIVYAGIPKDIDREEYINEAYRAVDEACCEVLMRRRVREPLEVPGALWHIYSARDSDKIRHLLTKVARERRIKLGPHQDPIHDQSWYLDATLRERLYKEYDVRGYAIVQCLGDAVFIPAGAPHQVRNLLNCIKVAEDFVSPENVSHCLHLTQEFRKLSDFHSNHEDKLQIKNIIYHAVKDSVSVLSQ